MRIYEKLQSSGGTENRRKRYVKNVSVIPCDIPINWKLKEYYLKQY